jgi:hypothetical protein
MKRETGGKASMMDLLEKKMDRTSEQVISSQDNNLDLKKDTSSQEDIDTSGQVISSQVIRESVRIAYKERPRVSFWSPRVSAIMYCLKKTIPDFSKSAEAKTLIEEALSKKYPELYKLVTDEIKKSD